MLGKLSGLSKAAWFAIAATVLTATATIGRITYETNAPVTREMVQAIRLGMNLKQIESITGRPAIKIVTWPEHPHSSGAIWLSDDLSLSCSFIGDELIRKEVRDDDLYPAVTLLSDLSEELPDRVQSKMLCKFVDPGPWCAERM